MTTPTEAKLSAASLAAEIAQKIKDSGGDVKERIVGALYAKEVESRADRIIKALDALDAAEKALADVAKPDTVTCDRAGAVVSETYSRSRIESIRKAEKAANQLRTAIESALAGDFSGLKGQ